MDENALESLLRIVRGIRKGTEFELRRAELTGELVEVAGRGGTIQTWLHRASGTNRPVVVELHGGGFALGDARKTDALRTWIAESFDVAVIGVNYRLAPENPFPAAVEDVQDVLSHIAVHADEYGVDASQCYLFGYSAGANLTLAACMDCDDDLASNVAGCILHYPLLDAVMNPYEVYVRPIDLSPDIMWAFNAWYLGETDPHEPRVSMIFASDEQLRQLPPVALYPVRGDALAAGAEVLAQRMGQLGKACTMQFVEDAYHGYIEDEANREAYEASTSPEEIAARPQGMHVLAETMVRDSLSALLGAPCREVPFPGSPMTEDAND